jgi:hypothetical protein
MSFTRGGAEPSYFPATAPCILFSSSTSQHPPTSFANSHHRNFFVPLHIRVRTVLSVVRPIKSFASHDRQTNKPTNNTLTTHILSLTLQEVRLISCLRAADLVIVDLITSNPIPLHSLSALRSPVLPRMYLSLRDPRYVRFRISTTNAMARSLV